MAYLDEKGLAQVWVKVCTKIDSKVGGAAGKSAYQSWLDTGHTGSEQDFVNDMKGKPGDPGEKGDDGKSAYELWKEQGNDGSVQDFLDSVRGKDGTPGKSAYELWKEQGNDGSVQDFLDSVRGKDGTARRALETGKGIEQLSPTIGRYEGERDRVMRYRAQGIFDISRARQKMYAEKLTPIARQVGQYMAGGDPNVVYTPAFERKATPVEPPVVPPIRPMDPSAPTVPEQPTLAQGPTPISAEAFDKTAFTRKSRARLMDGRTVYVAAVDFERRQVKYYNGKDLPFWADRDKVAAIV